MTRATLILSILFAAFWAAVCAAMGLVEFHDQSRRLPCDVSISDAVLWACATGAGVVAVVLLWRRLRALSSPQRGFEVLPADPSK